MRWKEKHKISNKKLKSCGVGSTEMQAHTNTDSAK